MNKGLMLHLAQKMCERYGIPTDLIDLEAEIDSLLTWNENKRHLMDLLRKNGVNDFNEDDLLELGETYNEEIDTEYREMLREHGDNLDVAYMLKQWRGVITRPSVVIITGKRGSGKSGLGYFLLEFLSKEYKIDPLVLGLPRPKWDLLPDRMKSLDVDSLDKLPDKAIIFIDEGALLFYARKFQSDLNTTMDKLISISRQKDQILLIATHHTRKLDINIITDADALIYKQPSLFHSRFERRELRNLTRDVSDKFERKSEDKRKWAYIYSDDFEGFLENPLPSFWSEELSHAFAGIEINGLSRQKPLYRYSRIEILKEEIEKRFENGKAIIDGEKAFEITTNLPSQRMGKHSMKKIAEKMDNDYMVTINYTDGVLEFVPKK